MQERERDTPRALRAYEEAKILIDRGDLPAAMERLEQCFEADPVFLDGRFLKARVHRMLGEFEEAWSLLGRCRKDAAHDSEVCREAAEVALLRGLPEEAFAEFENLLRFDPQDEDCCARLSALAFHLRGPGAAVKRILKCLKRNPDWWGGYLHAGHAYHLAGKAAKAVACYHRLLDRVPEHRGAAENLRSLKRGDPPRQGLLDQVFEELVFSEAVRLIDRGSAEQSLRLLEGWRPRFQDNPGYLEILARVHLELGQVEWARQAVEHHSQCVEGEIPQSLKARLLIASGDPKGASELLRRLCQESPESTERWLELAEALFLSGDWSEALVAADACLGLNPECCDGLFLKARILKKIGRPAECRETLEAVVRRDPGREAAHYALGVEYLLDHKDNLAVEQLRKALALLPDRAASWRHLAIAYTRLQAWEEARAAWGEVLRCHPEDGFAAESLKRVAQSMSETPLPYPENRSEEI
jgi:tetratricopeptide (TPR) repeat protein